MCGIIEDSKLKKPKKETVTAYKVFDYSSSTNQPKTYCGQPVFCFGLNVWDQNRADKEGYEDQVGFQMFARKKDAIKFAPDDDYIAKVIIQTKDIAIIGRPPYSKRKAYEVTKFELTKDNWNKRITCNVLSVFLATFNPFYGK